MKKIILFVVILLLSISFVQAEFISDSFFHKFNDDQLNIKLEQQLLFSTPFDSLKFLVNPIVDEKPLVDKVVEKVIVPIPQAEIVNTNFSVPIKIIESGFEPKEIKIQKGQTIVWKNERKKVSSLVYGLREIIEMKSEFIHPGEEFSWTFNNRGEFTYVDAVMIGRVGKVIVG